MQVKKYVLKKGDLSIMVTNNDKVDLVVVHTAECVSDNAQHIKDTTIKPTDKLIYICGHTKLSQRAIGGYKMAELASRLIKAGYTGMQDIFITACDSDVEQDGNISLKDELRLALYNQLFNNTATSIPSDLALCKVESKSDGLSAVTEDKELIVITATDYLDKLILNICVAYQNKTISTKIDIDSYDASKKRKISDYKNRILGSCFEYSSVYDTLRILSLMLGFVFTGLISIIIMLFKVTIYTNAILMAITIPLLLILNICGHLIMRRHSVSGDTNTRRVLPIMLSILTLKYSLYIILFIECLMQLM